LTFVGLVVSSDLRGQGMGKMGHPLESENSFDKYLTLRSISSINNPQNSETKFYEKSKLKY
jgi:hypothetical protein